MILEELLQKYGVDRNTLTAAESEVLDKWAKMLAIKQLTLSDIENHVNAMIESLERELTGHENPPVTFANLVFRGRRERHLKARLQNYIMLRDFVTSPERARQYIEKQLSSFTAT